MYVRAGFKDKFETAWLTPQEEEVPAQEQGTQWINQITPLDRGFTARFSIRRSESELESECYCEPSSILR
eukprot:13456981-Alexandrium_andersonii.AAC.1